MIATYYSHGGDWLPLLALGIGLALLFNKCRKGGE